MIFADLLSLHLITFLMFFILVHVTFLAADACLSWSLPSSTEQQVSPHRLPMQYCLKNLTRPSSNTPCTPTVVKSVMVKSLSQAFSCVLIGTIMVVVYVCMFLMSLLYLSSFLLLSLFPYLFCLLILNFTYVYLLFSKFYMFCWSLYLPSVHWCWSSFLCF